MKSFWFLYVLCVIGFICTGRNVLGTYDNNPLFIFLDFMGWSDFFNTPKLIGVFWYMCLAQIVVVLIPLLSWICSKVGWIIVPSIFIISQFFNAGIKSSQGGAYINYFWIILAAVVLAQNDTFSRLKVRKGVTRWGICLIEIAIVVGLLYCKLLITDISGDYNITNLTGIISMAAALMLVICIYQNFKGAFGKVLSFLGKHSGNIFIIHAFLRVCFRQYFYWSHIIIVTWLTLMASSLLISILIEQLKKLIKFQSWTGTFCNFICGKLNKLGA